MNSMKTKVLLMAVAMTVATAASAQKNDYYKTRHEIGVTIGVGATTEIFSGLSDLMGIAVSAAVTSAITGGTVSGYYNYGDEKYIPNISAEYFYHVNKTIGLGGFVGFNGMDRDMYVTWTNNTTNTKTSTKTGVARRRNLSIIPAAKFDWVRSKNFGMYTKAGLGLSFMLETQKDDVDGGNDYSDTDVIPNLQLSLIGLEGGTEQIRAFAELGFGEQGILLAGLKYKF